MVTAAIMAFLSALVQTVLSLFPDSTAPAWLTTASGFVSTVFGYAGMMGAWFPVILVRDIVAAVLGAYVLGFAIKVIRIVLSLTTMGGGSAG